VSAFIEMERGRFGVEPICRVLGVSTSAYYQRATGERSARRVEDERLLELIREIHRCNYFAYGSWRMWKALLRAGEEVGRGRVERLMCTNGIQGSHVWDSVRNTDELREALSGHFESGGVAAAS